MGNSQNQKVNMQALMDIIPGQQRQKISQAFIDEELQLLYQIFEDLRVRSKGFCGIDRDVFVKFCPIPGLWGHRIFNKMKDFSSDDYISFEEFIESLRIFCRSSNNELDENIFKIFDLQNTKTVDQEELEMMLINFPDIGFSNPQNINQPDRFYQNVKESVLKHVHIIEKQEMQLQGGGVMTLGFETNGQNAAGKNQSRSQAQIQEGSSITSTGMMAPDNQSGPNNNFYSSLSDVKNATQQHMSAAEIAQGSTQLNVFQHNARDLYLEMRNKMIAQTNAFFVRNVPRNAEGKHEMSLDMFKTWLDQYPFVRTLISESMMPRVWTLQRIMAVRPHAKEFIIETNPQVSQSTYSSEAKLSEAGDTTAKSAKDKDATTGLSMSFQHKLTTKMNSAEQSSLSSACLSPQVKQNRKAQKYKGVTMPLDSLVTKEGELLKIGKRTGTMRARYYVLRDQSLYIYNSKQQKIPSNLILLRGMFINQIKPDKNTKCHGFCIGHESKLVRTRVYYHKNLEVIEDWIRMLRIESSNLSFDEKYLRGPRLGNGKFSVVYQCQNKETSEVIAAKQIVKSQLTAREKDFLREEIQIIKLISHPHIVQMKETYETEKNMYIIMEQVSGGELFDHIKTYELEEREVAVCMFQIISAIGYLNKCGVVHRDLKPENILIEKDAETEEVCNIKLTDFGLSKIAVPNEIMHESCGTPAYVAPEVLHKKGYQKEVDMWSAGVIFYTLICRQLPFQMPDRKQTFQQIKEKDPNMALPAFSRFIPEAKDLIRKMLLKDPVERIKPQEALRHPYFVKTGMIKEPAEEMPNNLPEEQIVENVGQTAGFQNVMQAEGQLDMEEGNPQDRRASGEGMEFQHDDQAQDYLAENRSFTIHNHNNRQKDVKDELNVDRMKYAAYLDEDKDPNKQRLVQKTSSQNQMAAIEEHLGLNKDGTRSVDLPRKSRQTLDYIQLTKQQQEALKKAKKHKKAADDSEESSDEDGSQNYEIMFPEPNEGEEIQQINKKNNLEEHKEQEEQL